MVESNYYDLASIARMVAASEHRLAVGGAWEEIGELQFRFLVEKGMKPHHAVLDIGCGALRGGVRFIPYLEKDRYFGVDMSEALLDSGREELRRAGIDDRLSPNNLRCCEDFDFAPFGRIFDFAIAQSLFTHLGFNRIRRCLEQVSDVLAENGTLYATFFERPDDAPAREERLHEPAAIQTHDTRDPYHYSMEDLRYAARNLPLDAEYIGEWNHPRGQKMVAYRRRPKFSIVGGEDERRLSVEDAAELPAGAHHYRAYVGPPDRFDFMSATQFSLLFALGIRERHTLLDFGCGSLRLGRLMIPYLRPGHYFGVDPNRWLIDDGLDHEIGRDVQRLKQPRFSFNDDLDCGVFGTKFDFVIAQSILTHCGLDLFETLMKNVAAVLDDDGLFAFSYCRTKDTGASSDGWVYPGCVFYTEDQIDAFIDKAGLVGRAIPWYHPGAAWHLAALRPDRLPRPDEATFLKGAVLHDPQFAASRVQRPKTARRLFARARGLT